MVKPLFKVYSADSKLIGCTIWKNMGLRMLTAVFSMLIENVDYYIENGD